MTSQLLPLLDGRSAWAAWVAGILDRDELEKWAEAEVARGGSWHYLEVQDKIRDKAPREEITAAFGVALDDPAALAWQAHEILRVSMRLLSRAVSQATMTSAVAANLVARRLIPYSPDETAELAGFTAWLDDVHDGVPVDSQEVGQMFAHWFLTHPD
jgi:hypothetical protein